MKRNTFKIEGWDWVGEQFICDTTGIILTKWVYDSQPVCDPTYTIGDGGKDYYITEEVFNLIKRMII